MQKVKQELARYKITPVNYGVVGIPKDETEARKIFEFAKAMGLRAVTTESVDAIDTIEKLVKEYDIMVGFHDHPKRENDPNYRMWDPNLYSLGRQGSRLQDWLMRRYGALGQVQFEAGGLPAHPKRAHY